MSRELKRVALDFDWPLHEVWKGYLNPYHSYNCPKCDGSGMNKETKALSDAWYSFDDEEWIWLVPGEKRYNNKAWQYHLTEVEIEALVKQGRLRDLMGRNIWFEEDTYQWMEYLDDRKVVCDAPEYPSPECVNLWATNGFGHDAINQMIAVEARAKHLGVYGICSMCKGEGVLYESEEIKILSENWKETEPPSGEGFQLWENCTEGSPVSPVFKTLDELCEYAEKNCTTFGSSKATKEDWMKMLEDDFVYHQDGNIVFM